MFRLSLVNRERDDDLKIDVMMLSYLCLAPMVRPNAKPIQGSAQLPLLTCLLFSTSLSYLHSQLSWTILAGDTSK